MERVKKGLNEIFMDGLSGMALGLFSTLIIGTILAQIAALNELAAARGQTLAQMALSWVLKDSGVTSVLIGASRPQQIVENAAIVNAAPFTQQELDEIERIAAVQ